MEKVKKWPEGMNPIIALIPNDGAEREGQLRPIAILPILPYVHRLWMAVRKRRVKQWAMQLNDGRFSSAEALVWEIAARGELARLKGRHFVAAYIVCSKCYGRVDQKVPQKLL
eukprot:7596885-Heterocapsa_arctica.AAC.1